MSEEGSLEPLVNALRSGTPEQRLAAAERCLALGESARGAAVQLANAAGDEDERVREAATGALEQLGAPKPSSIDELRRLLEASQADIGYWAATLLGRLGAAATDAVQDLAAALDSQHPIVRQRAAWALGQIGPAAEAAVPPLEQAANSLDDRLARLAQRALVQIRRQ